MSDHIEFAVGQGIQIDPNTWYKSIQLLGTGGNSDTYLVYASEGHHRGLLFALKIFRRLSAQDRRERFLQEIEFLKGCKHPAIMPVHNSGTYTVKHAKGNDRFPFVVADFLPNTLFEIMRSRRASMVEKLCYSLNLLAALRHLSASKPQVIHRDIKPRNIFVKGKSCLLGDFGLMKVLDGSDELDRDIFKESAIPGMPYNYRTPDLVSYAKGDAGLTTKSDVFQLGLVLAQLFSGKNPASPSSDPLAPFEMSTIGRIPGDLGAGIYTLIKRMLTVDPSQRPDAESLMSPWQGILEEAVAISHRLEGKVF